MVELHSVEVPADNRVTTLPSSSRASVINLDLSGSNNTGVYFGNAGTNPFNLNNYTLNIKGNDNTGVYIANGIVNLGTGTANAINIAGGSGNIGIFAATAGDALSTAANITVNADSSSGIFAQNTGTVTNTGNISASGASVKAIIADNTTVNSTGNITVNGTALGTLDGSARTSCTKWRDTEHNRRNNEYNS